MELPVAELVEQPAHLYLWTPNALLPHALAVMASLGLRVQNQHCLGQGA